MQLLKGCAESWGGGFILTEVGYKPGATAPPLTPLFPPLASDVVVQEMAQEKKRVGQLVKTKTKHLLERHAMPLTIVSVVKKGPVAT
jgi:hypothetical protein